MIEDQNEDQFLSPNERNQRRKNSLILQKIDNQINLLLGTEQSGHIEYRNYLQQVVVIQQKYTQEIEQLRHTVFIMERNHKLQIQNYEHDYQLLEKRYKLLLKQMQEIKSCQDKAENQNSFLRGEIKKYKMMVENQQNLIDDYKNSIEEQILLQKEFIRSIYDEKQNQLKNNFSRALIEIQKNCEEKIRKVNKMRKIDNYEQQFKSFKRYLTGKKENILTQQQTTKKDERKTAISTSYSTVAIERVLG